MAPGRRAVPWLDAHAVVDPTGMAVALTRSDRMTFPGFGLC